MRVLSVLIQMLFLSYLSYASDWDILRNDGQYTYVRSDSTLRVLKIRTVKSSPAGNILFNFHSPEITQGPSQRPACVIENGAGWMGRTLTFRNDGWQIITNNINDSIRFNPNANVSESWKLAQLDWGLEIRATITAVSFANISSIGKSDSVKTISLAKFDENGVHVPDPVIDNSKFQLSRNYGFIQLFDMFAFPDSLRKVELRGIGDPSGVKISGMSPITFKDVFDFQVGDEFHIFEGDTSDNGYGEMTWRRIKVLSKNFIEQDNLFDYEVDLKIMQIVWDFFDSDTAYADNIANLRIDLNRYSDYLPEQSYKILNGDSMLLYNRFHTGEYNQRQVIRPFIGYTRSMPPCYSGTSQRYDRYYSYIEGCGEFFERNNFFGSEWKRLVYFKKSGVEYGKKLDFVVGVFDNMKRAGITISPNPARDYIEITVPRWRGQGVDNPDDVSFRIFDLLGTEITSPSNLTPIPSPEGEGSIVRINVSHLAPGVYFVRVGDVVGKFVKM